jgi:hypothetical protein
MKWGSPVNAAQAVLSKIQKQKKSKASPRPDIRM